MRRFVILPTLALLICVTLLAFGVRVLPQRSTVSVPVLDDTFAPGRPMSRGMSCSYDDYRFDLKYCHIASDTDAEVKDGIITSVYIFTYSSDLRAGDIVQAWNAPTYANYGSSWTEMYWPDRFAYMYDDNSFSPQSKVGFVAFGSPHHPDAITWKGFKNG